MDGSREAALIELTPQFTYSRMRVRQVTFIVASAVFLGGIVASIRDPRWALLSAAVVLGWSKIGGA
ncbi:MAG TPA: hypothetical protein VFC19_19295 [Candidatus Limnocylindrales bacterium]|nr:hypothetical protein [Candidatus Limnocylindrales bacterium]